LQKPLLIFDIYLRSKVAQINFLDQPAVEILKKKRKVVKQVMVVTGRADISVILQGSIDQINQMVIDFKKIKDIVTTETLIEVEVDLGW